MPQVKVDRRKIDRIDLKILTILQQNARITNKELAEQAGLSARPCLERVRRLMAAGYVRSLNAILEPAKFGNPVTIYAHIALATQERRLGERFEAVISRVEEAVECFEVSGDVDYLARFICPSLDIYYRITASLLENAQIGVRRIDSTIVLRTVTPWRGLPASILQKSLD
ncbi:Lrp/AsnC family transcriptional regulator [Govanella unica]|uniref:Lrp/AsnC family transcriptional regulator n=1 Tax=Govanella unica TaxID=2975056 RepID=A0A9X3Z7H3_9PROT|nr:Lrp/AsnC family transcriptional regulator [Govania unica]MDA5194162.1 Lrp/AsnC family transcriptional regulator [Govania unica]